MDKFLFFMFACALTGIIVWMMHKEKTTGITLGAVLLILSAFYLFQFGKLSSFSLEALSAKAQFIRNTADEVRADSKEIREAAERILALEQRLKEIAEVAAPPVLNFTASECTNINGTCTAVLRFTPSKNEPLGMIVFGATISGESDARITDLWPDAPPYLTGDDSKQIADDGKAARLVYQKMSVGEVAVRLKTSAPATVTIDGNHGVESFEVVLE